MNLTLSGHHMDLSEPLREYVGEKIKRIERHYDRIIKAEVVLTVEKSGHKAEANIHAGGADIHAAFSAGDMYAAIDGMIDRLDEQARRHKTRRQQIRDRAPLRAALDGAGE